MSNSVRKERFNIDLVGLTDVGTSTIGAGPKSRKPATRKGKSSDKIFKGWQKPKPKRPGGLVEFNQKPQEQAKPGKGKEEKKPEKKPGKP